MRMKLKDFCEINPRISLKKGEVARKIAMTDLPTFGKTINNYTMEEYKGGTKFQNGDTLMARITPCLENGKGGYVDLLDDGEVAFGSTEYIVFREKIGVSDSQFLYYFINTPSFRDIAIKSMTGSSGRQRVQTDVISDMEFEFPELEEQKKIAQILCSLDDKITLNSKLNANLEEMINLLYKRYFYDFEGETDFVESEFGQIPKSWEIKQLDEVINLIIDHRGKTPKKLGADWSEKGIIALSAKTVKNHKLINIESANRVSRELYDKWMKDKLKKGDILLTSEAPMGEMYYITANTEYCLSQRLFAIRADEHVIYPINLYMELATQRGRSQLESRCTGSTVVGIKQAELRKVKILIPPIQKQEEFYNTAQEMKMLIENNNIQNTQLASLRDSLLPRLMMGTVDLEDITIF